MSATYVVCGLCGEDSSSSADAIRHKPDCPRLAPPVSETAAWTEQDLMFYAERPLPEGVSPREIFQRMAILWAREILRLRADNEEQALQVQGLSEELERVREEREQIRAATRERETPPQSNNHTQETGL